MGQPATFGTRARSILWPREEHYDPDQTISILRFTNQFNMAERELSAFFTALETFFGREQAILSAEDWLDGNEQVLGPNQPCSRDWRAVTIVASLRLAHRLAVASGRQMSLHQQSKLATVLHT